MQPCARRHEPEQRQRGDNGAGNGDTASEVVSVFRLLRAGTEREHGKGARSAMQQAQQLHVYVSYWHTRVQRAATGTPPWATQTKAVAKGTHIEYPYA